MNKLLDATRGVTTWTPAQIADACDIPAAAKWHAVCPANMAVRVTTDLNNPANDRYGDARYWCGVVGQCCAELTQHSEINFCQLQPFAADQSHHGPVLWRRWDVRAGVVYMLLWDCGQITGRWTVNAQEFDREVPGYDFATETEIAPELAED